MLKKTLTSKQQRILECIKEYIYEFGYPPSVREICSMVGLNSPSTVHMHIKTLSDLGYLQKDDNKPRAISFNSAIAGSAVKVPIVGTVAAGNPILAEEDIEGYITYDDGGHFGGDYYALKIRGESMKNAGILDGDIVVVRKQETAQNGEIVVAMLDGEATVKRLKITGGRVQLCPENPSFFVIEAPNVQILGKVISVIRHY